MKKFLLFTVLILNLFFLNAQNKSVTFMADSLKDAKEFELATNEYLKIIKNDTISSDILNSLAYCYFNMEMLDSALSTLNRATSLDKNNSESYSLLSEIFAYVGDYTNALIYIKTAIIYKPDSVDYYIKMGSIYLLNNDLEKALDAFETSLNYKQSNPEAYYMISYIYHVASMPDSAVKYINFAIDIEEKGEYHQLKAEIFYSQGRYTDAIFEMDKAINIEGKSEDFILAKAEIYNQLEQYRDVLRLIYPYLTSYSSDFYHYAVVSYFNLDMTDSAFYYLDDGLKNDPLNDNLYYLQGYIYYVKSDYNNAMLNFEAAIELNPNNVEYFVLISNSKFLLNTSLDVLDYNNFFYDFNVSNLKKMKKQVTSKKSNYFYPKLRSKFNTDPSSLSLDEYFMFYFGHSFEPGYSGYGNQNVLVANAFNSQQFEKCIELSLDFLSEHPCSISTYNYLANSFYMLGDYSQAIKYLTVYYGFINGILATGDGTSPENSMIVISPADEYAILLYNDLQFAGQETISDKKNNYDIFYYYYNNIKQKMYFYIDLYFGKN